MKSVPEPPGVEDLSTSSEFLSLASSVKKVTRSVLKSESDVLLKQQEKLVNGHVYSKDDNGHALRSLKKRQEVQNLPAVELRGCNMEVTKENGTEGRHFTRQSARLQAGNKKEDTKDGSSSKTRSASVADEHTHEENGDAEVRRSCRLRRNRYENLNQSMLFDKLITNTAEAVLQKMDDMKKMRRRMREFENRRDFNDTEEEENLPMYSRVKQKNIQAADEDETTDNQDDGTGTAESTEEEGEENEEDEDGEDHQKRYDFRQRKTIERYQAPLSEPRHKKPRFYSDSPSPVSRRYRFGSAGPRSPFRKRRVNRCRHAIHSSDSTSSSSSSSSSDDEDHFEKRRARGRSRTVLRCLPLNLRKEDLKGIHKDRLKIGGSLADVDPMLLDRSVRFSSVGGLSHHISALKEMVVFPLLYPEIFEKYKIQPPRGCLFYGPPGTGKTLVARALANECSIGDRRVSFFMRKGADCLSKWVGESERQLRLLFDQAYSLRPSIIFFDEIDGLAPVRSSRQDQIHSSIVSTLLALMDGLDSRGEVVVIGATNRLDSIDPALRRPGRFDREFLFNLPDRDARTDILKIHTADWIPKPSDAFLEELADKCVGYCGADMKCICAEAVLCALRRRYPQIYSTSEKLLLDASSISITAKDFAVAMEKIVPASQRAVTSPGQALSSVVKPLLENTLNRILLALQRIFPHAEQGLKRKKNMDFPSYLLEDDMMYSDGDEPSLFEDGPNKKTHGGQTAGPFLNFERSACLHPMSYRPRLLLAGRPGSGQSTHLAPALLHKLEKFTVHTLDLPVLFGISATSPEESCAQIFREAKRTAPSIVYIPCIYMWWETVSDALRAIFMMLLQGIPSFSPILLLATCEVPYEDLSEEIKAIFLESHGHVFSVELPSREERRKFFSDLILIQAAKPPASRKKAVLQALEVLPVASPPEPRKLTEEEMKRLEEQEENTLRELRIFLRNVTHRLCIDKRFRIFTKPVDPEEVPDYYAVIKQPMDLSNVMKKIDLHNYCTAKDYLKDIDLMCSNALEYNPDTDPAGRSLRHRACTLKDTAYAILKEELDEEFEKFCEEIQESRKKRGCCSSKFAPSYCHVLPKQNFSSECRLPESDHLNKKSENHTMSVVSSTPVSASSSRKRHRRRSQWSCGTIAKKKKYSHSTKDDKVETEGDRGEHDSSMELTEGEINEDSVIENESDSALQDNFVLNSTSPRSYTDQSKTKIQSTVKGNAAESLTVQESSNADAKKKETKSCNEENSALDCSPQNYLNNETAVLRMTRARRSQVEHQQHIDVEKALDILSSQTPQLVVDHERLRTLLKTVTEKTEDFTVFDLEKVYAVLSQCIYQHRKSYDKTDLIENMEKEVDNFQR